MTSVDDYANWRGVTPQRVRQLLRSGELPGRRIGSRQWIVDDAAFNSRVRVARPMAPPMAWGLIAMLGGEEPAADLTPVQRSRLREHRNKLVRLEDGAPALLASWVRLRGERLVYQVAPADIADLSHDARLMKSGVSDPRAGISATGVTEVWLRHFTDLDEIVGDYLLLPDPKGQVVMHRGREHESEQPQIGLVMADLADWNSPREDARVIELLARVR
ncbi:hypothetical protein [Microbacterium sp.]|uniref:hypothetical protein n=1 Tax=Microbacterium sp. TaxID=51671 RepID=UPI002FE34102